MDAIFAKLRQIRTPIVYDAIERFKLRPREVGYTDGSIKGLLPSLGAFVGTAITARVMAELPGGPSVPSEEVWSYVARQKTPSIMVCQDMDQPAGRGCAWGDVSASIFTRLGCVAVVTNGAARDIREVERIGFGVFASHLIVGHANIRFVEIGGTVKVGGLVVNPGDLIHADEHGAVIIPKNVDLEKLLEVAGKFMASERAVIDYARDPGFSVAGLKQRVDRHDATDYGIWEPDER